MVSTYVVSAILLSAIQVSLFGKFFNFLLIFENIRKARQRFARSCHVCVLITTTKHAYI